MQHNKLSEEDSYYIIAILFAKKKEKDYPKLKKKGRSSRTTWSDISSSE